MTLEVITVAADERDPGGLQNWGVTPSTPVREVAERPKHGRCCPEDGAAVGATYTAHVVDGPTLLDDRLEELTQLTVYGWKCDQHRRDVVLVEPCSSPDAPQLPAGWIGVPIELEDGREILTPALAEELPDEYLDAPATL